MGGIDVFNIGNNEPIKLMDFITTLESSLEKKAKLNMVEMVQGDVPMTYADIGHSQRVLGYQPATSIDEGLRKFAAWYLADERKDEIEGFANDGEWNAQ